MTTIVWFCSRCNLLAVLHGGCEILQGWAQAAGLCLQGRGAIREIPERLQSGHRGWKAVGGRLLAVGNAVGAGVGVWEWLLG